MKILRVVLSVVSLIVLGLTCPLTAAPQRVSAGSMTIVPAPGWTVRTSSLPMGARLVLLAPGAGNGFQANLNVLVESLSVPTTFEKYFEANISQIEKMGGSVVSRAIIRIGGQHAGRLIWSHTMQSRQLQFHSTFFLLGNTAYVVTCTALAQEYARYALVFERMADSAKFSP